MGKGVLPYDVQVGNTELVQQRRETISDFCYLLHNYY